MSRIRRYILFKEQAEHPRVTGWFSVVTVQVVHSPNVRYKLDFKGVLQQNVPCQFFFLGWKTHACLVVYLYVIAAFAPLFNILTVN